jgi:microcystin-dependent protein
MALTKTDPSMLGITGVVFDYAGATAPEGWLFIDGKTIGNASSGGTSRANADTADLFALLWDSFGNTQAPVSGGRGASAAADFAANKTITLPDGRGRVLVGRDNMGGSAAGRMTSGGSGVGGDTLGSSGGSQTHSMSISEMPTHGHPTQVSSNTGSASTPSGGMMLTTTSSASQGANTGAANNTVGNQVGGAGGGNAHNNTQPTLILNKIIKL